MKNGTYDPDDPDDPDELPDEPEVPDEPELPDDELPPDEELPPELPPRPPEAPPPLRFHSFSSDDSSRFAFCKGWCVASSGAGGAMRAWTAASPRSVDARKMGANRMVWVVEVGSEEKGQPSAGARIWLLQCRNYVVVI